MEQASSWSDVPRLDKSQPLPLGLTQERFWYLSRLAPESAIYNLPAAFRLRGVLDAGLLHSALAEIVRRHDSLRTTISSNAGEPFQSVHEQVDFTLELEDLSHEDDPLAAVARAIDLLKDVPVDSAIAPMVVTRLFRLADDDHVLFWMPHHLIWDGWSFDVFLHELDSLYGGLADSAPARLEMPELQYPDYAVWHKEWSKGPALASSRAFWRRQLDPPVALSDFPTDHPRPEEMSYRGARVSMEFDEQLTSALGELGRRDGATLFMVLLAGFYCLLYRYSEQSDLAIGCPVQARIDPRTENAIGVFVNTLVLRLRLEPGLTFRELLARVKDTTVAAFDQQATPFEVLVEETRPERSLSHTPLFQVLFSYQDVRNRGERIGNLALSQLHIETSYAPTDLTAWVMETGSGLLGGLDYAADLFDRSTAEQMIRHYGRVLREAAAHPDQPLAALAMLAPEEHAQLHRLAMGPEPVQRTGCIVSDIEAQVRAASDRSAVEFDGTVMTYGELWERSGRVAAALRARGLGSGDLVGGCFDRGIEMIVGFLSIWRAGCAFVPLDPAYPDQRLAFMASDAGLPLIVTDGQGALTDSAVPEASLSELEAQAESAHPKGAPPAGDALAYVIYTSGSTGQPKGVAVTHANLASFLDAMVREPGLAARDTLVSVTSPSFDISMLEFWGPLSVGARVVVANEDELYDGQLLAELLRSSGATVMQATPSTWRLLIDADWEGQQIKAMCGGEPFPPDLADSLIERTEEVWNLYGPTETTVWSTAYRVAESHEGGVPIGRPIAGTCVYVVDAQGSLVPQGVPGELCIGGMGVARGYLHREALTGERFVPAPANAPVARVYRTGDRVRWRSDGCLEHLGRIDTQVKVHGHRIELGEVEAVLTEHADVRQAAAVVFGEGEAARLAAYVVLALDANSTGSELRAWLRKRLPRYMVPGLIADIDVLPLTPNNKIDRRALPNPFRQLRVVKSANLEPPATPQEVLLAGIWSKLLGVQEIDREHNFFELGGHSLMTFQIVHQLREHTGYTLDPRVLFFQTLSQVAASLPELDAAV